MTAAKRLFSGSKVACARGGRILFQNLSFGLGPGDIAHLAGPNGAGKTSLLRMMAGALPLADGKIQWDGRDFLEKGMPLHAARLSFLPADDRALKSLETAGENLGFWAALASPFSLWEKEGPAAQRREDEGTSSRQDRSASSTKYPHPPMLRMGPSLSQEERGSVVDSALKKMDILNLKDVPVRRLSAGQRRRLSLARVFLKPAKLWLLDEPFNGLDMKSYDLLMDALEEHGKAGGIAVVASHYAVEPPKHGKMHRIEVGEK